MPRRSFNTKAGNIVGSLLEQEPREVRERASEAIWLAVLTLGGGNPFGALARLEGSASGLATIVKADLPPEAFGAAFTPPLLRQGILGQLRTQSVPSRLLRGLLPEVARFVRGEGQPVYEVAEAVSSLGAEDLDLLIEFVADKYNVGIAATTRVWNLDPDRALHEARAAIQRQADTEAYAWFYSAPRARYAALLDALEEAPASSASWATRWLSDVLPVAGPEAPRVFGMMRLSIPA